MAISLMIGILCGVATLIYVSFKPVPIEECAKEKDEGEAGKEVSTAGMGKKELARLRKEQTQEALRENLYRMNPTLREVPESELLNNVKGRKEAFLKNMDEDSRQKFLEAMDTMKGEMKKIEKMTDEEMRARVTEHDANQFRMILCKGIVLFLIGYVACIMYYGTGNLFELKKELGSELSVFLKSMLKSTARGAEGLLPDNDL